MLDYLQTFGHLALATSSLGCRQAGGLGKFSQGLGRGQLPPQGLLWWTGDPPKKRLFLRKNKGIGGLSFSLCNLCRKLHIDAFGTRIQAVHVIRMRVPENPNSGLLCW